MNYNNIEDLSDEMLNNLIKKAEAEKTRREKVKYDEFYNSFLKTLRELVDKYPYVYAGNFGGEDLDWTDVYNIIRRD